MFTEIYFCEIRFILADANFGIFHVVKFCGSENFSSFAWTFFSRLFNIFLKLTVSVVEIERFLEILPKLKPINQCDNQFSRLKLKPR